MHPFALESPASQQVFIGPEAVQCDGPMDFPTPSRVILMLSDLVFAEPSLKPALPLFPGITAFLG